MFDGHTHSVTKVIELMNGNLASCSLDKTVNIWDRQTGDIVNTLEGFDSDIRDIQEMDPDTLVIVNSDDNAFMVWNHKKELEENCMTFEEHDDAVTKVIVVNQKYLYSSSADSTIKRWYPKKLGVQS